MDRELGPDEPPGPGRLAITRWHLRRPPGPPPDAPPLAEGLELRHVARPTVGFYRYLYGAVGEDWLWGDRRRLSDAALAEAIAPPGVELHMLLDAGAPAGFFELDFRPAEAAETSSAAAAAAAAVDLAYFGLTPWMTGRRVGPSLLAAAVARAQARSQAQACGGAGAAMTVNTCTLDHPKALALYQRAGFEITRALRLSTPDPRLEGLIRREAAPHVPLAR